MRLNNQESTAVPMRVTIQATSIQIIAINIPAPSLKNSVPNIEMTINTRNAIMIPVKSQTPAFQIICHHPGCGGSIVVMGVIKK